jgi:hypothetical protein
MAEHPAVVALDLALWSQQPEQRNGAESDDHAWLNNRDLSVEVGGAGDELVRLWVAVPGRVTQHRVGDVCGVSRDPRLGEQPVKEAPGGANKRAALAVLVLARGFAQEKQP